MVKALLKDVPQFQFSNGIRFVSVFAGLPSLKKSDRSLFASDLWPGYLANLKVDKYW